MEIRVEVTKADIDTAKTDPETWDDPIQVALERINAAKGIVGRGRARHPKYTWELPISVGNRILHYLNTGEMMPFEFVAILPMPVQPGKKRGRTSQKGRKRATPDKPFQKNERPAKKGRTAVRKPGSKLKKSSGKRTSKTTKSSKGKRS